MLRRNLLLLFFAVSLPLAAAEDVDLDVVHRIRNEAMVKGHVMDHLFQLVDVHGPRITGSPGFQGAAEWAAGQLREWGLENVKLEKWGPFGQGWSRSYYSAHLVEPGYEMLIGVPLGWTPSTDGVVKGSPVIAPLESYPTVKQRERAIDAYIAKHRGKLRGSIVLLSPLQKVEMIDKPMAHRYTNEELARLAEAPEGAVPIDFSDPDIEIPDDPERRREIFAQAPPWFNQWQRDERNRIQGKLNTFLTSEGVRLVIEPASRGDGGTVFPPRMGDRDVNHPLPPPAIAITPEQYNRIFRLVEKGLEPKVEVEVRTTLHKDTLDSLNVVGEIPGGAKKDEVVMIGAHLDSTAAALGATDNGSGSAVMLEVIRILKTLDLKLDRTVRIALWGGEEQGLLGSKAYVKEHFGDPETMKLTARHAKLAGYFNVDNGSGKIRGVYLQGNDMARPIFDAWLRPFADLGAKTLSIRDTGGTDHLSFDAVGLPGFQFIQDPLEYSTRTHHSNMDAYDRAQPADLMQAAAIVASFVYNAANRGDMLPRKPLPDPQPLERPESK
ncbi:MAG: M20/M25/M40 family metallo-hydrolase [Acidobacteria bacterium]|nr:M20/M25/M40 family metallo-hydrolase [Acidobacteriota bacterium]